MTDATQPKARKDASLTMRVTRETRDALDARAREMGLSVSRVAELWLNEAVAGQKQLGAGGVAEALRAMAGFAEDVRREVGEPERQLEARDALMAGWKRMIGAALPFTPDTAEGVRARMDRVDAKMNARLLMTAILDEFDRDPEAMSLEEGAWANRAPPVTNALSPLYGAGKSPLQLLLDYQNAEGTSERSIGVQLVAALNSAPSTMFRFAPSPLDVAVAIETSMSSMSAYMAPRQAAKRKGEALADSRAGIGAVEP